MSKISAERLEVLASAADDIAYLMVKNGGCSEASVRYLRDAAEDARREAADVAVAEGRVIG